MARQHFALGMHALVLCEGAGAGVPWWGAAPGDGWWWGAAPGDGLWWGAAPGELPCVPLEWG